MHDHRVAFVIGTRPEAIKLSPLAKALTSLGILPRLIFTGQHPRLDPAAFGMKGLTPMSLGCGGRPDPNVHAGEVARRIRAVLEGTRLVVVQGDTSSALGGTLGAAMAGIPVAHVEAGLRSHDRYNPWPEEDFRIAIDANADLLFAPTQLNAANLRREDARGRIIVTGNTGIDALFERIRQLPAPARSTGRGHRLLVTCHRRESWGNGLEAIAACLREIACRPEVSITVVLHPNPTVSGEMRRLLGDCPNVMLQEPCSHGDMLQMMRQSDLILSDSGGVQEEAPCLGIPLLVLRERTERPEGIASGNALLVGRDLAGVVGTVRRLLDDGGALAGLAKPAFPYGDGRASPRIAAVIAEYVKSSDSAASTGGAVDRRAGPPARRQHITSVSARRDVGA